MIEKRRHPKLAWITQEENNHTESLSNANNTGCRIKPLINFNWEIGSAASAREDV
jgi:hypothetical protein